MNENLYRKLVDLYAARELPTELEQEMEAQAGEDDGLAEDMHTLRATFDSLRDIPQPEFTEESNQRILMRLYTRGADIQPAGPSPVHLQYHLPMQG